MTKKMTRKQLSYYPPGPCVGCVEEFLDPNPHFDDPICVVCKIKGTDGWTCRGGNWLCTKCSQIPFAVFHNNGTVGVTCIGGPADGRNLILNNRSIINSGLRIPIQDNPYHIKYKFDWDLGFFVLEEK